MAGKRPRLLAIVLCAIFPIVGISLIAGAVVSALSSHAFSEKAVAVDAVIADIVWDSAHDSWTTVVGYEYGGERFFVHLGHHSSSMRTGDSIEILVDPDDPVIVHSRDADALLTLVLSTTGACFLFIGSIFILGAVQRHRHEMRLKKTGILMMADIYEIREAPGQSSNGRHPLIIHCRHVDPQGRTYLFHSSPLWRESWQIDPGVKVPVHVDKDNPSRYFVDAEAAFPDE